MKRSITAIARCVKGAVTETLDVNTERTGVRTYVARGLPRSGSGLDWIRKRLAFYHDPCPLVQLGARRDRVLLQRPQRGASKIGNCVRRTPTADGLRLCLARLRSEMRPLRPHHQSHARGNQALRDHPQSRN
jgi:hypothetical protein